MEQTQAWLADQADEFPVYQEYLDQCNVWVNPWDQPDEADQKVDAVDSDQ